MAKLVANTIFSFPQLMLPVWRTDRAELGQYVRGVPSDAGGHYRGHTEAGHLVLLQVL